MAYIFAIPNAVAITFLQDQDALNFCSVVTSYTSTPLTLVCFLDHSGKAGFYGDTGRVIGCFTRLNNGDRG